MRFFWGDTYLCYGYRAFDYCADISDCYIGFFSGTKLRFIIGVYYKHINFISSRKLTEIIITGVLL